MDGKSRTRLEGIEQTLLLPLWGRYSESIKPHGLINDPISVDLAMKMDIDVERFQTEQNPGSRLAWVARAWNTDHELGKLLSKDEECTVLCLGSGLDTAFFRNDSGNCLWYDIDFPEVVELRRTLLPENERVRVLSGSVLKRETYAGIRLHGKVVVLAVGLLYYFTPAEIETLFSLLSEICPRFFMIAEVLSPRGVRITNKRVVNTCAGTKATWAVRNGRDLESLSPSLQVKELYPLFRKIRPAMNSGQRRLAFIADLLRLMSFAVLEVGNGSAKSGRR